MGIVRKGDDTYIVPDFWKVDGAIPLRKRKSLGSTFVTQETFFFETGEHSGGEYANIFFDRKGEAYAVLVAS